MLLLAQERKEEVEKLLARAHLEPRNRFYFTAGYVTFGKMIAEDTWNCLDLVSVESANGPVKGYVYLTFDRQAHHVSGMGAISFCSEPSATLARDLLQAIRDALTVWNFNKVAWSVVVGNPIEATYDKLCERHGGRVVGVKTADVRLADGTVADFKLYELMRSDFVE